VCKMCAKGEVLAPDNRKEETRDLDQPKHLMFAGAVLTQVALAHFQTSSLGH